MVAKRKITFNKKKDETQEEKKITTPVEEETKNEEQSESETPTEASAETETDTPAENETPTDETKTQEEQKDETQEENTGTTDEQNEQKDEEESKVVDKSIQWQIVWNWMATVVKKPVWSITFEAQQASVPLFKVPADIRQYLINKWWGTNVWKKDKERLERHWADMKMIEKLKKFLSNHL